MTKLTCVISLFFLCISAFSQKAKPVAVPMNAAAWEFAPGSAEFSQYKGIAAAKIVSDTGKLVLKNVDFSNGTIEFDVESLQPPFAGIYFRRQSDLESEYFYLRVQRAGFPLAIDAIQYAPFIKGILLWDMYDYYQGPAPLRNGDWNHVKLVISGMQMLVYINDMKKPVLQVPRLEGNTKNGSIALTGRSVFANLVIKPGETEGLSPLEGLDPIYNDSRYLKNWQVTSPVAFPFGKDLTESDLPSKDVAWKPIVAERRGLVNLTREFGGKMNDRKLVWIKTSIKSDKEQIRKLNLGFSDEAWVLVNGQLVYMDKNWYGSLLAKEPDGRCSVENTSLPVTLKQGDNEIMIGVVNFFFGWGVIARLDKTDDLSY